MNSKDWKENSSKNSKDWKEKSRKKEEKPFLQLLLQFVVWLEHIILYPIISWNRNYCKIMVRVQYKSNSMKFKNLIEIHNFLKIRQENNLNVLYNKIPNLPNSQQVIIMICRNARLWEIDLDKKASYGTSRKRWEGLLFQFKTGQFRKIVHIKIR